MRDKHLNKTILYYLRKKKKLQGRVNYYSIRAKLLLYKVDRTISPDHYPGRQSSHKKGQPGARSSCVNPTTLGLMYAGKAVMTSQNLKISGKCEGTS
jgi:hypothetical protein